MGGDPPPQRVLRILVRTLHRCSPSKCVYVYLFYEHCHQLLHSSDVHWFPRCLTYLVYKVRPVGLPTCAIKNLRREER